MAQSTIPLPSASDFPQTIENLIEQVDQVLAKSQPSQLVLFADEYQRRSEARDAMAYRAVGSLTAAICFCRKNRVEDALAILTLALERYNQADDRLQSLKKGDAHAVQTSH